MAYDDLEKNARAIGFTLDTLPVARDGDCFYTAIDRQFSRHHGTTEHGGDVMRRLISDHLKQNDMTVRQLSLCGQREYDLKCCVY